MAGDARASVTGPPKVTEDRLPNDVSDGARLGQARLEGESAWPVWLRVLVTVCLVAVLVAPLIVWRDRIAAVFAERAQVSAQIRATGAWGPLAVIGLAVAQTVAAPIPGQVVNFAAGYLYGFWPGAFLSWLGAVLGSTLAMALARVAGRRLIQRLLNPKLLDRLDRLAQGRGLGIFFLVFLLPGLPDDAACFLAGLTPLPLSALILAAAVGRIPGIAAAVWVGATAQTFGWQGWLMMIGLAGLVAIIVWRWGDWLQEKLLGLTGRS